MNRAKALFIADRIMTRIETDKAIHKDAIADEIQAGDALDVISYDEAKGQWVHRDGSVFDVNADQRQNLSASDLFAVGVQRRMSNDALIDLMLRGMNVQRISLEDFKS